MTRTRQVRVNVSRVPPSWRKVVLLGVVGVAIWLPRGLALDRFVTVDEPSWLTFSGNFYSAIANGEFGRTFQIAHPGVTTTWVGTAAFLWRYPAYAREAPGQIDWVKQEIGPILRARGHDPMDILAAGRTILVAAITVVLTMASIPAVRLTDYWTALVGFLLIAADPFHIALSRVLHVDALMSSLMLVSLLTFLSYLHGERRQRDLVISAVAAGLACLTKAPALFLGPFVGLLTLGDLWRGGRSRGPLAQHVRWAAQSLVTWSAVALLVFVLAWPAMWVHPIDSLLAIAGEAVGYARSGHTEAPLFFNGAIVRGDPGLHFYPVSFLWRTTPVVLIGLGIAAAALALPRAQLLTPQHRRTAAVLFLFVVLFTGVMSLGAKKFDRYLLPVYAPLDLVTALGWVAGARWLSRRAHRAAAAAAVIIVAGAVVAQAAMVFPAFPYYFSYYNPLFGGTTKAPNVMMIGWGEGLDQAARYLNAMPDAERLRVTTWFWNGPFSYFFKGKILPGPLSPSAGEIRPWLSSDYTVIYINQRQRGRLPRELLEHVDSLTPVKVILLQDLQYAQIYDLRGRQRVYPPPDHPPSAARSRVAPSH